MKKVVLTGHSKGLGKALALALIKEGCYVLGLSRSRSYDLNGLQQVTLDLSDGSALLQWIESGVLKTFLDGAEQAILINNSGVVSPVNLLGKQANEDGIPKLRISSLAPGIVDTGMQADIRSRNVDEFPQVAVFKSFKTEGILATPEDTAAKITQMLLSSAFGEDLITDVRDD
jgi:NAD(P)-dependent dehydrogenase (short-subunit alcohol dehydrogenase family)